MVLRPEKEAEARAVFEKWDLDFAIVGETIPEDRFLILLHGEVKADLPLKALSGTAPEYDRPWVPTPAPAAVGPVPEIDPAAALLQLIGNPNLCSRAWIWSQYDYSVMADTVVPPGSDAALVRVHGTDKAIAFTSDVTPRYCLANPEQGGMQAVAEAYRNISATGAMPLAATDNLNFGNPEKPEIMGQLVGCIQGIGKACAALGMPIVSGNVSLYNETDGRAILPTPTIGGVGLLDRVEDRISMAVRDGDRLFLIGETRGHLGRSLLLSEVLGREEGDAPPVDLAAERRAGDFIRAANRAGHVSAAHDLSDGGLAVAAVEMALAGKVGVALRADAALTAAAWFFGEDQGRYLLACPAELADAVAALAREAGVAAREVGIAGGTEVSLGEARVVLAALEERHRQGLSRLFD